MAKGNVDVKFINFEFFFRNCDHIFFTKKRTTEERNEGESKKSAKRLKNAQRIHHRDM